MSQENAEVVSDAIAAFNRAGPDGALDYFDPDVEWVGPPEWPEDHVYEGHDGLRRLASGWTESFDEFRLDLERTVDAGNRVVALAYQRVRIKDSENRIEHRVGWACEMRGGKIARVQAYFSWEAALEAVGLAE
jgi:ketosteroid isomerase-like protein